MNDRNGKVELCSKIMSLGENLKIQQHTHLPQPTSVLSIHIKLVHLCRRYRSTTNLKALCMNLFYCHKFSHPEKTPHEFQYAHIYICTCRHIHLNYYVCLCGFLCIPDTCVDTVTIISLAISFRCIALNTLSLPQLVIRQLSLSTSLDNLPVSHTDVE